MKADGPVVYIGIVTYKSAGLIIACVTSLLTQRSVRFKIIVLDNNSKDMVARVVKHFGNTVTFIQSTVNLGFGGGHNAILRSLPLRDSDYYMAVNPDATPEPDCVARLVRASQRHAASWVTGKLYKDMHKKIMYSVGHALQRDGYAFNIGYGIIDQGQYDMPREVFGAPGAAVLYQGSMVRMLSVKGNFFDPNLFMYYEDIDIDWRARLQGLRCWYEPAAVVKHPGGNFPRSLEAEVLTNRFLCILKNAFISDLIFYNLPLMWVHVVFRIVITPAVGFRILQKMIRVFPSALRARSSPRIFRQEMHAWFLQSAKEASQQPVRLFDRIRVFAGRLLRA